VVRQGKNFVASFENDHSMTSVLLSRAGAENLRSQLDRMLDLPDSNRQD